MGRGRVEGWGRLDVLGKGRGVGKYCGRVEVLGRLDVLENGRGMGKVRCIGEGSRCWEG